MVAKNKKPVPDPSSGDCAIADSADSNAEPTESFESKNEVAIAKPSKPRGLYPTALLRELGFDCCNKCGAQFQSDIYGNPVCPENLRGCPRV